MVIIVWNLIKTTWRDAKMKEINIGRVMTGLFTAVFLCCASAFVALADVGAAGVQATIQSCLVNSDKNSVAVQADSNANMAGTDGVLYLVASALPEQSGRQNGLCGFCSTGKQGYLYISIKP